MITYADLQLYTFYITYMVLLERARQNLKFVSESNLLEVITGTLGSQIFIKKFFAFLHSNFGRKKCFFEILKTCFYTFRDISDNLIQVLERSLIILRFNFNFYFLHLFINFFRVLNIAKRVFTYHRLLLGILLQMVKKIIRPKNL